MENEDEKKISEEEQFEADRKGGFYQQDANPESAAESNRKSGMAYAAVFGFVASIVAFLGVGWVLDTYFGTAPMLLVGGVIFGTVAGFYQFYRLISRL